jgi:SAM-dependent methyltransferase
MTTLTTHQIKDPMRSTWMAGDFGEIAKANAAHGEAFISRLPIPFGARVLDVACGTGNVTIPLARQGAVATGVDIATNLLAQARERAAAEGLTATFDEGDAEQLPYADASFDAVVSMFGAIFAPRPELVASELGRVLKPGALLAMANWSPSGFYGQINRIRSLYVPSPPGLAPPVIWGDETTLRERLKPYFTDIRTELIRIDLDMPMSPSETVDFYRKYFGPMQIAFDSLDEIGQSALAADLESLWSNANVAPDPSNHTLVHSEYLQAIATRR